MTLRTSFRGKLLLLTIAPLAIAQIVTLLAVMRTVESDVDRRARDSLMIGGNVVGEFLAARGEQLGTSVEVLAADFGLKQAAATRDADTIRSVLRNHSERVGADLALYLELAPELHHVLLAEARCFYGQDVLPGLPEPLEQGIVKQRVTPRLPVFAA